MDDLVALDRRDAYETIVVVLAGGSGERVGLGLPKQLLKVAGKTVLEHTLDALHRSEVIDKVVLVISSDYLHRVRSLLGDRYQKLGDIVLGGASRNGSTQAAIRALGSTECKVLFHDAVRPFVDEATLTACVRALDVFDAVDVVVPTPDTIVMIDEQGAIANIPDRSALRRGQTPQGFLLSTIRTAYELAGQDGFIATDDCSMVLKYLPDVRIQTVAGSENNMKITYPLDLFIADRLFQHMSSDFPHGSPTVQGNQLAGRTMVVFGGSYGIGRDLVALARGHGATVYSFSRSGTGGDVRDPEAIEDVLRSAAAATGRIDHVVNTAAVLMKGPLAEMSPEAISEQIHTNLLAPALIARASLPFLEQTQGQLLFFTSSSYTRGRAEYGVYSATKAAVVNLTQALADEWSSLRVRVNCINPERTKTTMRARTFGEEASESLLSPEEVARTALEVLVSTATGQIVDVRRTDRGPLVAGGAVDGEAPDTESVPR